MTQTGHDEHGKEIKSDDLWKAVKTTDGGDEKWYKVAVDYWDKQEASYNGVLGGYGFVSDVDLRDSQTLLLKAFKTHFANHDKQSLCALDAGAGVGRVTQELLLRHFGTVDLLEPSKHLLDTAQEKLTAAASTFPPGHKPGKFFYQGLEKFEPEANRYDCLWLQWCLLYLTDDDLVDLFVSCKRGLKEGGLIVIKENLCSSGFVVDREDNSLTRSHAYWMGLFARAGVSVALSMKQKDMPEKLYQVKMYVVRPKAE